METLHMKGAMVFDSHSDHSNTYPIRSEHPHLEIIFSPTNLSADDYILEYLSTHQKVQNPITLVTSDNELAFRAKSFGASIMPVKAFLKFLHEKKLHSTHTEEKPSIENSQQVQRLLDIFEGMVEE